MRTEYNYFNMLKRCRTVGWTILSIGAVFLIAGCASMSPTTVRDAVGPVVALRDAEQNGFLKVYTATAWTTNDDEPQLLRYTDFEIDAADGRLFQQVSNGGDEPTRVTLPKG